MVPFDAISTVIEPPIGVAEVTSFQAKAALSRTGFLAPIESYMARSTTDPEDRLRWDKAVTFRRDHPLVLRIAQELRWTDAQLDALFALAKNIVL